MSVMDMVLLGFSVSLAIAVCGYHLEALDSKGTLAAVITGTVVFGFAGAIAFVVYISFFLFSLGLGFLDRGKRKKEPRTHVQVLANGLVASILALAYGIHGHDALYALFIASVAVSAADTMSSEVGLRYGKKPWHFFKHTSSTLGLSGVVTWIGLLAGFLTALLYGLATFGIMRSLLYSLLVFGTGFFGTLIDSALGVIQVKYTDKKTNRILDTQEEGSEYHSGFPWLSNNLVNFLTNLVALFFMVFFLLIFLR